MILKNPNFDLFREELSKTEKGKLLTFDAICEIWAIESKQIGVGLDIDKVADSYLQMSLTDIISSFSYALDKYGITGNQRTPEKIMALLQDNQNFAFIPTNPEKTLYLVKSV